MIDIRNGDALAVLKTLPDTSVQTCVTSPPYFGLRDYGHEGQMGLERTPGEYIDGMVALFAQVRRVLKDDGTLWLNIGDSYAADRGGTTPPAQTVAGGVSGAGDFAARRGQKAGYNASRDAKAHGLKHKDLIGIPWMLAFALRADGWYLRSDIIWHKPNPMPESVTDRPTKAHEYVFLLSKSAKYFYDAGAIAEPVSESTVSRLAQDVENQLGSDRVPGKTNGRMKAKAPRFGGMKYGDNDAPEHKTKSENEYVLTSHRNARTVWSITTQPFKGAHFATMPPELAKRCVLAGSRTGDTVLDPFGGAGTTGLVADRLGRDAVLIELNPEYAAMARARIMDDAPLFAEVAA